MARKAIATQDHPRFFLSTAHVRALMKRFVISITAGIFFVFQGCAVDDDIVNAVKKIRQSNRDAQVDVSNIVKDYILIGMPKKDVEDYFNRHRYSLYYEKNNTDNDIFIVASIKINRSIIGFYDEIRVIIELEDEKVKSTRGWLFFHAL